MMQPEINFADKSLKNYHRIARAIDYLAQKHIAQPNLSELATAVGVSKFHLQRLFTEWAGVSPKQFLQYLTKEYAKQQLRKSSVFDAAVASGLSGGGRLHDLMLTCENVTPGEYKSWGEGLEIRYGLHPSRFGDCFVALTHRGICKLAFVDSDQGYQKELLNLKAGWRNAKIIYDKHQTKSVIETAFNHSKTPSQTLHMLLKGSPFQIQVWEALLSIPETRLASYQQIADAIDKPSAVRAVASAISQNQIAYLIPCHRVIRNTGVLGQYHWGETRKGAMIAWEAALAPMDGE